MDVSSATNTASSIQMDYMKLLVTQLQNQNPLEPMNNSDMASQLAQFSELSQLENLNSSFSDALSTAEHNYAGSLIGKEVSYVSTAADGTSSLTSGKVEQVVEDKDKKVFLVVGNDAVGLDEIVAVKN
jgi:flagellar basal-body rod modification protein FlgD